MPELAEVEFYRRQWDCGLGQRITAVELHPRKRIFRGTNTRALVRHLTGAKLVRSTARGKQMLFEFSGDNWLGVHLGMTGKLSVESPSFRPAKHDHLVLRQTRRSLIFNDARQFGRVRFHHGPLHPEWWPADLPQIGERAFTRAYLDCFLDRHRRAPIKAVLLLQSGFPGIGNWMADEILWRAKIARPSGLRPHRHRTRRAPARNPFRRPRIDPHYRRRVLRSAAHLAHSPALEIRRPLPAPQNKTPPFDNRRPHDRLVL